MKIGPYTLSSPWILAPMAGVSQQPYRMIARSMGASAAPTELVSAKALAGGGGGQRALQYLRHHPSETPFWVQLFGGDPDLMAKGARRAAELGAKIIDLNMGCPVKKITKKGAGSALLMAPSRAARIVRAMYRETGLPITVKIRAGWDSDALVFHELTQAVADAGAVAVAMHARTTLQGYDGRADWSLICQLVRTSPIPVIGNGDVMTVADAQRMLRETGCQGVMIGRAALGNPWFFRALHCGVPQNPTPDERRTVVLEHFRAHLEFVGDELRAVRQFRQQLRWYAYGLVGAEHFTKAIVQLDEANAVEDLCEDYFRFATLPAFERAMPTHSSQGALG